MKTLEELRDVPGVESITCTGLHYPGDYKIRLAEGYEWDSCLEVVSTGPSTAAWLVSTIKPSMAYAVAKVVAYLEDHTDDGGLFIGDCGEAEDLIERALADLKKVDR